jgi:hypothetical protein
LPSGTLQASYETLLCGSLLQPESTEATDARKLEEGSGKIMQSSASLAVLKIRYAAKRITTPRTLATEIIQIIECHHLSEIEKRTLMTG